MTVTVVGMTSAGGLPLFLRKKEDGIELPFPAIASLNGVHMFAKTRNVQVQSTMTEDSIVVWKEYHHSVILICIANAATEEAIHHLLDCVFHAMVITVGLEDIKNQKNVERLKRDLRISYPLIDRLMDCVEISSKLHQMVDLVGLSEACLCPENHLLQTVLDTFSECMDSLFGCVLIHGKIAVATKNWWALHPTERKLLSIIVSVDSNATARDIPIFLPFKSPEVAFRLVTCSLITGVDICVICGPKPELCELDHIVMQCFRTMSDVLKSAEQIYPRNFPKSIQLGPEILGLLLINTQDRKYMLTRNIQATSHKRTLKGMHRLELLRTFYYEAVEPFLIPFGPSDDDAAETGNKTTGEETYWCSEYHTCHAAKVGVNILCVLYTCTIPTHTMRMITQKTLKELLADKQTLW